MELENPTSKLQAFYLLQAQVCGKLPSDAVTQAVRAGKVNDATRAKNVIHSLTKDLNMLVAIVECTLPTFTVSPEIKSFM